MEDETKLHLPTTEHPFRPATSKRPGRRPSLQIHIRSPEINLKGRNQGDFRTRLRNNVRHRLRRMEIRWPVRTARGRLFVDVRSPSRKTLDQVLEALCDLPGVEVVVPAIWLKKAHLLPDGRLDEKLLEREVVSMARKSYREGQSFAVRARRIDKRFPRSSTELEFWLGEAIREQTDWDRVRLNEPDRAYHLDVYNDGVFVYDERLKGVGGLPVGSSRRVLSLLSGGIDSPVASYLLARRGCPVDWFHMSAAHLTEADFESSAVGRIARRLSRYTLRSRLFVVPYTHFDLALPERESGYEPVLFRRFLFRAAEAVARRTGAMALVTGDSLAQVASQTMENLIASNRAVDAPVLRPLIGHDKQEIMELARAIGTYETSIEPTKDCCALYSPRARTRTDDRALSRLEERLFADYERVLTASLEELRWAEYDSGELIRSGSELETAAPLPNDPLEAPEGAGASLPAAEDSH